MVLRYGAREDELMRVVSDEALMLALKAKRGRRCADLLGGREVRRAADAGDGRGVRVVNAVRLILWLVVLASFAAYWYTAMRRWKS